MLDGVVEYITYGAAVGALIKSFELMNNSMNQGVSLPSCHGSSFARIFYYFTPKSLPNSIIPQSSA